MQQICVIGQGVSCPDTEANARFNVRYWYDNVGNVTNIINPVANESMSYTYDALDRLTNVSGAYGEGYTYDAVGNILSKGGVSFTAYDPNHKHAVTHLNGAQKFWYDQNGNMTTRVEGSTTYAQGWDAENRLATVTVNGPLRATTFIYDGDGNRVKKMQGGQTTVYIGALYEKNVSTGVATSYYFAGGTRVAMRQGSSVYWLVGDHLGSTSVILDINGAKVGEMRYTPFGETRLITGSLPTDRRYTGQRQESVGLGSLYDYGARFYSPALGRFLSADTIVPGAENPQAFNRYAYVVNSPLKYNDPTGHCFFICGLIGGAIGAIAGAVGYTAQVITTGSGWNSDAYWASVGAGAGTGALIGSTLGVVAPVALEATSVTLAGASAATGSGTLAVAATNTYAAATTLAAADSVVVTAAASKLSGLRLAPSSPAPSVPGSSSPLALPAPTYENPRTGEIVSSVTQRESTYYQVASTSDAIGRSKWLSLTRPASSSEAISGLSLPPGNTASYISEVTVPSGIRLQTSTASPLFGQPGGWLQAELLERSPLVKYGPPQPLPRGLLGGPR